MRRFYPQARRRIAVSTTLIAGVIALIGVDNATAEQIGPSFDCHSAQQPLAQMLCSDPDLSRTDLRFAQAYFALLKQVGDAGKAQLKQEDLQFLDAVQRQCGVPSTGQALPKSEASRNCVKNAYEAQRTLWVLRLTPPFSEEANRPIERHIALQRSLQQLGFLPADAAMDGVYGAGTRDAISKWQSAQGRSVTGVLGDADAKPLDALAAGAAPQGSAQTKPDPTPSSEGHTASPRPNPTPSGDIPRASTPGQNTGAYMYQGFNVKSADCLAFWRKLDAQVFAKKDNLVAVSVGKEKETGGDILVGVEGINRERERNQGSCYEFGNPTFVSLTLPDSFNLRLLLDESYVVRVAKSLSEQVTRFAHKMDQLMYEWNKRGNDEQHYGRAKVFQAASPEQLLLDFDFHSFGGHFEGISSGGFSDRVRNLYRERVAEETRQAQVRARTEASRAVYDGFVKRGGIEGWPSLDELVANPFAYEGKTIGLWGSFSQMVARDRGIFAGKVLLSSLPVDVVKTGEQTLVAGKVLGNEFVDTPFGGKVPLPLLKFVDIFKCQQTNCEDAMFWKINPN
jgi:uncharacterized protein YecT (DUF1311 family)